MHGLRQPIARFEVRSSSIFPQRLFSSYFYADSSRPPFFFLPRTSFVIGYKYTGCATRNLFSVEFNRMELMIWAIMHKIGYSFFFIVLFAVVAGRYCGGAFYPTLFRSPEWTIRMHKIFRPCPHRHPLAWRWWGNKRESPLEISYSFFLLPCSCPLIYSPLFVIFFLVWDSSIF